MAERLFEPSFVGAVIELAVEVMLRNPGTGYEMSEDYFGSGDQVFST